MKLTACIAAFLALFISIFISIPAFALNLVETPSLAEQVATGKLPPVGDRLPEQMKIVQFSQDIKNDQQSDIENDKQNGQHGGQLRMLMA